MIAKQRKIHRVIWILLAPLLLLTVLYFSAPETELSPANAGLDPIGAGKLP